jgi:AraC family transcriptional regulator
MKTISNFDPLEKEYLSRINKTIDFIEANLVQQFTLGDLASAANFSKYHFHRIFHAMMGETPFQFILRIRLEKAASLMVYNPTESISEIAFRCGFTDISIFSRNFRQYFGKSATDYRKECRKQSNLSQKDSNGSPAELRSSTYFCFETKTIKWRTSMKSFRSAEVAELPPMTVAYIRYTGPYKGNQSLFEKLWNQLFSWAGPRGLIGGPEFKSLIIYHDDPNVTAEDKLRMSVCITVPADTKVGGEVGKMQIDGGKYVIARFVVKSNEFQEAWEWVYGHWFPSSGYQPDDKPCFEIYPEAPKDDQMVVDICVPVKAL